MAHDTIQDWLRAEADSEAWSSTIYALASSTMAAAALTVTSLPLGFVSWMLSRSLAPANLALPSTITLTLLGLAGLFVINARTAKHFDDLSHTQERHLHPATRSRKPRTPNALLAYPGFESGNALHWVLLGPRLADMARGHFQRSSLLRRLDLISATRALEVMLSAGKRIPVADLIEHAKLQDATGLLLALRELPGVVLLTQPPPSITLTGEYRTALSDIAGSLQPLQPIDSNTERAAATIKALHATLGISTSDNRSHQNAPKPPPRLLRIPKQKAAPENTRADKAPQNEETPPSPRQIWQKHRPPTS